MIRYLKIKNFKSHKETELNLNNLTILCGANGFGKSSIIHSLLLLRDTYLRTSDFNILNLNSNSIKIGNIDDALFINNDFDGFSFKISTNIQTFLLEYNFKAISDRKKTIISLDLAPIRPQIEPNIIALENLFNTNFQFISAARLEPQTSYRKDDLIVDIQKQISFEEGKAELCVHFLEYYKNIDVLPELLNSNKEFNDLFSQTIAWEREISEGINIIIIDRDNLGYELKYSFDTSSGLGKTKEFISTNVGYGITYVLPIIVAILSAKKDALLIIENPEAHLHPNGIAKLTELICIAAQAGIQIIIETHSDHIMNGVLVQSKKFEESQIGIDKDNVSIYHFERDESEHCTKAKKIEIEENGKIRYPPKAFFDQFTIDRKFLMGF